MRTQLKYFDDSELYEYAAIVLSIEELNGRYAIILDQTIFYPQGGGQPYDLGVIEGPNGIFDVQEVRLVEDVVYHYGLFRTGMITVGQKVKLMINQERREINARLHSAGHLIDVALENIGVKLEPTKGFHFPEGPYVEYKGIIAEEDREKIQKQLEEEVNSLISRGNEVRIQYASKEELIYLCGVVPDYINDDKPIRVITISGKLGYPCGGTHVKNISDINHITINKIKSKSGNTRISYTLQ